jgi:hypothetical protein
MRRRLSWWVLRLVRRFALNVVNKGFSLILRIGGLWLSAAIASKSVVGALIFGSSGLRVELVMYVVRRGLTVAVYAVA